MSTFHVMTADQLQPGDRVLDHEDGTLFVIDVVERIDRNQLALVDADQEVLVIDRDEHLFLDAVLPRVWRYRPDVIGLTISRRIENVAPGDRVTIDGQPYDVMGVLVAMGDVTLYEGGHAAVTRRVGTFVEVDR